MRKGFDWMFWIPIIVFVIVLLSKPRITKPRKIKTFKPFKFKK